MLVDFQFTVFTVYNQFSLNNLVHFNFNRLILSTFSDLWQIAADVESKTEMVLARMPSALPKRTSASVLEYARRFDIISRYADYPDIVSYLTALSIKAESGGLKPYE